MITMTTSATTRRNQCYHQQQHARKRRVRTTRQQQQQQQQSILVVITILLCMILLASVQVVDAGKGMSMKGKGGSKGDDKKSMKKKSGKKYYDYTNEQDEDEGTLIVISNNIFRPVAQPPPPPSSPEVSVPVPAPVSSSDVVVYCDELYYGHDRQLKMGGSKGKGGGSNSKTKKNKKNKKYSDEVYLDDLGCILRPDYSYGKGGSKGKGKGKGGGSMKMGSNSKGGKGKGGGWDSSKGGGSIPDGLFRAPSLQPVAEPTVVPSSNIIEASDSIDTCKTVNGTIGTVTGTTVDPFIATFTYQLVTVPAVTAQTVTNLIVPALEQAFGDYLVPYVLDESVLEECSTITELQKKWEWIAKILRQQNNNGNRSKLEIQQAAEAQWAKQHNKSKYEDNHNDVIIVERRSGSVAPTTTAVGMSGAPADKINPNEQCSTKSQQSGGNPCFVMLGEITVYLQQRSGSDNNSSDNNNTVNNNTSRGLLLLDSNNNNRLLQQQQQQQTKNVTMNDNYQDAIRAAIKEFMNNTENYAKVSPLIVQLSYVEPEPIPSSRGINDSSSNNDNNDDGVNKALIGGLIGGLGGCLLLVVGIGAALKYKQKQASEQISLVQQNAEISNRIIDEEDTIHQGRTITMPSSQYVAPDPLAAPTSSS